ncbi:Retrotransposon polyprotein [Penicillium coprophilum]|uniref:Retrotransposon polyprotein n=1 Tax=Penicillium coprophilum TaxID=36646 RepID=UPI002383F0F3|nr:Retrotransposon polyprotein [Penicillium coprophilum]KAJ5174104.1 Retrotransposon polyprotein [Penicillium coprophilum]
MALKSEKLYTTDSEPWILEEYKDYQDIFTLLEEGKLPKHSPFDHKINIIEGSEPTFKPIYQLL